MGDFHELHDGHRVTWKEPQPQVLLVACKSSKPVPFKPGSLKASVPRRTQRRGSRTQAQAEMGAEVMFHLFPAGFFSLLG